MVESTVEMNNKKVENKSRLPLWLLAPVVAAVVAAGCGEDNGAQQAQQRGGGPQVGYITAVAKDIALAEEHPGRLEAYRMADVRARVAGVLEKRLFEEGSDVKEGQVLFQIDNAPYRAALQSAQAQLASAQAQYAQAKAQADRFKPLVEVNAVSKQDYDNAKSAAQAGQAGISAASAAIKTANINLGYAAVKAPIAGRIGRSMVTEGALVGQTGATELAVIQQIDPLYVNMTQNATDVIRLQKAIRAGEYASVGEDGSIPISVVLSDGTTYEHQGKLLFTDLSVDPATGQVSLRAILPNPDKLLLPGLYVRVQIEQAQINNSYLVPQGAVHRGSTGDMVYLINAEDQIEPRPVTLGGRKGNDWVVSKGLNNGDRVMIDGLQTWQMAYGQAIQMMDPEDLKTGKKPQVKVTPISKDKEGGANHAKPMTQTEPKQADEQSGNEEINNG